jgi:hypothetical protein
VNFPALHSKFVDLGFRNVSPLFGLFQFMLELAEFCKASIGLFLLGMETEL